MTTLTGWPLAGVSATPVPLASMSGVTRRRLITALAVPSLAGSSALAMSMTTTVLSQRPLAKAYGPAAHARSASAASRPRPRNSHGAHWLGFIGVLLAIGMGGSGDAGSEAPR